jgi:phosphohistidine phosphatase SixA
LNIYLMRHGIALPIDAPTVARDADRPLGNQGIKRMAKAA